MRKDGCTNGKLIRQVYLFIPNRDIDLPPFHGYRFMPRGYVWHHALGGRCQLAVAEQDGHTRSYSRALELAGMQNGHSDQSWSVPARVIVGVISADRCGFGFFSLAAGRWTMPASSALFPLASDLDHAWAWQCRTTAAYAVAASLGGVRTWS